MIIFTPDAPKAQSIFMNIIQYSFPHDIVEVYLDSFNLASVTSELFCQKWQG